MARFSVTASMIQSQSLIFGEIVIEIAGGDEAARIRERRKRAGRPFQRGFDAVAGGLIARAVGKNEIEQQRRNLRVGEMRGNAGTHGSRLQERRHGGLASFR